MEISLTKEFFAGLMEADEAKFTIVVENETLPFQITEVNSMSERTNAQYREGERLPFSVVFLGPETPVLTQSIRPLQHPRLGTMELFLVPLGPDDGGVLYEAVFA